MSRELQSSLAVVRALTVTPALLHGGTGQRNEASAATAIGALSIDNLGVALGAAKLGQDGFVPFIQLPSSVVTGPTVDGPINVYVSQVVQFLITNYDENTAYTVSVSAGSVNRVSDIITFTAPATLQTVTMTVNDRPCTFAIKAASPLQPSITSPVANSIGLSQAPAITASVFAVSSGVATHLSSDWQIATDPLFTNVVFRSLNDVSNKVSWSPSDLLASTVYFVRVKYKAIDGSSSSWSSVSMFTTGNAYVLNLVIASNTSDYNMRAAAIAAGWNQVTPLNLVVTVNSGVTVGSTSTSTAAFRTDTAFPVGSNLQLFNNGIISGMNNALAVGGDAMQVQTILTVTNKGTIRGGSGTSTGSAVDGNNFVLWLQKGLLYV